MPRVLTNADMGLAEEQEDRPLADAGKSLPWALCGDTLWPLLRIGTLKLFQ